MSKPLSLLVLACACLAPAAFAAPSRPPTVDPTYGMPLPAKAHSLEAPASAAQWVWADTTTANQTVYFRREFPLTAVPKTAAMFVTADDFFTLFVNGRQVDQSLPDPNDENVWQRVHQVNAAPFLRVGRNLLAVRALNANGAAGFLARLELPGQPAILTNGQWKVSAAVRPGDWTGMNFDETGWRAATVIAPQDGGVWAGAGGLQGWPGYGESIAPYLTHLPLPFARVADVHPGAGQIAGAEHLTGRSDGILSDGILTVTPPPAGAADLPSVLLDAGKEVAGRVLIEPLTDGIVSVGTGESNEEALHSPWGGMHSLTLTPGKIAATRYSAFRYVRLVFPPGAATSPLRLRVMVDHKYYPVQYKGSFACSDPLLTKLWYTGAYTSHLCMQEDIWDAPKRDRARWAGDLHVSGEVISNVFADKFLMEQTLTRLRDDAGNGHVNGIPGFSCAWICTLADFHRHLGDYAYLNRQHDRLISLLEYLRGDLDERGLFANKHGGWTFVDWSPDFDGDHSPARAATHLFLAKAVQESVFLLREMGDMPNAAKYVAWGNSLDTAGRQYLADPATQTYGSRLQENAMAIYSGVATKDQRRAIYARILAPDSLAWDKSGAMLGNKPVLSPYYGNYVIFAMSEAGHNADAMRVLHEYWGGMLAEGATTFWEAYDPKWPKAHFHEFLQADNQTGTYSSLCHGWSSGPTNWLTERVMGVRPTGGGFKTVEITPDLGDLAWAEGSVPTPHGLLHVRAAQVGGKLLLTVTVPGGVKALVRVHGLDSEVTLNGRTIGLLHRDDDGRAQVPITAAGTYRIAAEPRP